MKTIKAIVLLSVVILGNVYGWEINTHRAIDRKAIEASTNLKRFLGTVGMNLDSVYTGDTLSYDGYNTNYLRYIVKEESNGISKWNQSFTYVDSKNYKARIATVQDLIEAGAILEDAQWPHWWIKEHIGWWDQADGRFNNHFADPQNDYNGLTYGYGSRESALLWAWGSGSGRNEYDYQDAIRYFHRGFASASYAERRRFQAKMLVSVGHIMHVMNDMNVPAHTRDDAHPFGDALEWWARGGEDGNESMGFYIRGSSLAGGSFAKKSVDTYRFGDSDSLYFGELYEYMQKEAEFTGTHFFSGYAQLFTADRLGTIEKKALPANYHETPYESTQHPNVEKCYIVSDELDTHNKLAIKIRSYFYDELGRKIYGNPSAQMFAGGTTVTFQGDVSVLEDNAYHLIPRAIANAAGFLNYFFRGSMEIAITYQGVRITNTSDAGAVASSETVNFKKHSGILLFYDDKKGIRHPFPEVFPLPDSDERSSMIVLPRDVPSGGSIFIPFDKSFRKVDYEILAERPKLQIGIPGVMSPTKLRNT